MKYMLIAGEASGDLHAAEVIKNLRKIDRQPVFMFMGGDLMANAAGRTPLVHYREMAYMGFSEVVRNLGKIRGNLSTAKRQLRLWRPDALILVDYPTFNLKVATEAHVLGIPVFWYVSPKVWAWKEWRVSALKRVCTRMMVIFPFEVAYYKQRHNWDVTYVGNPSVSEMDTLLAHAAGRQEFLKRNKLRDREIIALLPGSRIGEIRNNLEVMEKAVMQFPQYRGVVAGAPGVDPALYAQYTKLPVVFGQTVDLLKNARAALVTSGTATLEAALASVPQVACYRSNGSKIAYNVMKRMLSVDFVTLPNLIVGREIIPELLLHHCTEDAIAANLAPLLRETGVRHAQLDGYKRMRAVLGIADAGANAARVIYRTLINRS